MPNQLKAVGQISGQAASYAFRQHSNDLTQLFRVDSHVYEAYNPSNAVHYRVAPTEAAGTPGTYTAPVASGTPAGTLFYDLVDASNNPLSYLSPIDFDGANEITLGSAGVDSSGYLKANAEVVTDKAGYALSATGLDAISVADPGSTANHTTLSKMLVATWRALWRKNDCSDNQARRYGDDEVTVNSTASVSSDTVLQTVGAFS